jgi:predicted DnaQ family exonuclease/DinG family helicase
MIEPQILHDLKVNRFVAVDIETTGLEYLKDEIIEIAAVLFVDGVQQDHLQSLLKPTQAIPYHISRLTGITNEMVAQAPSFNKIAPKFMKFIGNDPLIIHNATFDIPFLEYHLLKRIHKTKVQSENQKKIRLRNTQHDTLTLARIFLPFQAGFSLVKLAEYFHIDIKQHHRALPDASAAAEIFLKLIEIALHCDFKDIRKIVEILESSDDSSKNFFLQLVTVLAGAKYHFERILDKESFIYSTQLFNIIGEEDTPESGQLVAEPIDEKEMAAFFDREGMLEKSFGKFEHRSAQIEMSEQVARAFNESKFLVVEAGTGTGKSMAYLLPAIKWSVENYGPAGRIVISTNTKNLQEQLFFKDLPILHSILKEKFKAVLLKGKANYLCLDKWFTILNDMKYRLSVYEREKILPLVLWVKKTETGDISENNGFAVDRNAGLWSKFIAEDNYCPGRSCKYYKQCFLWRVRNQARDAHLVLVNHSLLFSDLAAENSILNEYVNVIFDEAHNIEKVATDYLGMQISWWDFRETLQKLYQKEKYETGLLIQLKKRLQLSDLESIKKDLLIGQLESLIPLVSNCWIAAQGFFKELTSLLRILVADSKQSDFANKFRYQKEEGLKEKIFSYHHELTELLRTLQNNINSIIGLLREIPADSFRYQKQIQQELFAQMTSIESLIGTLDYLISAEWDNWVYWFELPSRQDSDDSRLYAVPLEIAEILNEKLYGKLKTGIFTSATLTVGKTFNYFNERIGLHNLKADRLQLLMLDSPFNFKEQALLAVPAFIPDPRSPDYREAIKNFIEQLVKEQPRGTLVLFTSHALLRDMYESLRMTFEAERITLLAQGISGNRHSLINEFKQHPNSYLFGTDSFWEGIDVPGKALEILLITKLPFDVPTEPVIQAKAEMIQRMGGNPFMDFTIPEAVIRLRQGFGRLIRSTSDFGAVIILDNRIIKKMYGQIFLESLPASSRIYNNPDQFWEELLNWFQKASKWA